MAKLFARNRDGGRQPPHACQVYHAWHACHLSCHFCHSRQGGAGTRSAAVGAFTLGPFAVRGEDARISDDVLVENLDLFAFRLGDFSNASAGAEWLMGLSEYLEAGGGLGFYRRTVASTYDDFVDVDGSEIEQDLKLRVIPFTTTIRFLPFGRSAALQPYVGVAWGSTRGAIARSVISSTSPTSLSSTTGSWPKGTMLARSCSPGCGCRLACALRSVGSSGIRPSRAQSTSRMASSRRESTWVASPLRRRFR